MTLILPEMSNGTMIYIIFCPLKYSKQWLNCNSYNKRYYSKCWLWYERNYISTKKLKMVNKS